MEKEQLQEAVATGSPEAQPNYKSICRQLQQKNEQLGKAYQDLKVQFDELEDSCQEKEEQLAQAQQDADEMADMVRENEQRIATYTEQLKEKDDRIKALEQELRTLKKSSEASSANHEAAAKVDRNDLAEIHRRYGGAVYPEREEMQPEQHLQTRRHSMQHDKRLHRDSKAKNCQWSDIPKHLEEAERPKSVS